MLLYYEHDWISADFDELVYECENEYVDVDLYGSECIDVDLY